MSGRRRALVLGSGGLTGLAWQVGVLAGLADAGVPLEADLVVGTSAGALLAARLAGGESIGDVVDVLAGDARPGSFTWSPGSPSRRPDGGPEPRFGSISPTVVARLLAAQLARDRRQALVRLGRWCAREWTPAASAEWVEAVAGDLSGRDWPATLVVVATDATTGRPVVLGARRPVDLAAAVAASCAMPGVFPAVPIGGRPHFDGGLRSPANLDVAGSADVVLALAPLTGALRAGRRPGVQAARLWASGSSVVLLTPDATGRRAIGVDVLAAGRVPACLAAGRALGFARAAGVRALWR